MRLTGPGSTGLRHHRADRPLQTVSAAVRGDGGDAHFGHDFVQALLMPLR